MVVVLEVVVAEVVVEEGAGGKQPTISSLSRFSAYKMYMWAQFNCVVFGVPVMRGSQVHQETHS